MLQHALVLVLCCSVLPIFPGANGQVIKLPKLNIDPRKVSLSGGSSGAAMATQYHFAHSSEVLGVGLFAGAPYMCAKAGLTAALCMSAPGQVNLQRLIQATTVAEMGERIDPTFNMRGAKVFIYHGSRDPVVGPSAGPKIADMYSHYLADIKTKFDIAGGHGMPTSNYGALCGLTTSAFKYINKCNYDGAFEALNHIYGGNLTRPDYNNTELPGDFASFDQSEFFDKLPGLSSMDSQGFVYVPSGCRDGTKSCSLHVALHGCQQYRALVGDIVAKKAGYLEVAELNDIVMLSPLVVPSLSNPMGCWDVWGYLGPNFPNKNGVQVSALHRMINRLVHG